MEKPKQIMILEEEDITYSEDIYSEDCLDEMVDDDTISAGEYGFMKGYLREQELEE